MSNQEKKNIKSISRRHTHEQPDEHKRFDRSYDNKSIDTDFVVFTSIPILNCFTLSFSSSR